MKDKLSIALVLVCIVITASFIVSYASRADASAPSGLSATASTSPYVLPSRTATTLIGTTTCAARVVSTTDKQVMLTFTDALNESPTGTYGHMQLASTTVVYDGGQYGCGKVKVWADAATNITFTDSR